MAVPGKTQGAVLEKARGAECLMPTFAFKIRSAHNDYGLLACAYLFFYYGFCSEFFFPLTKMSNIILLEIQILISFVSFL